MTEKQKAIAILNHAVQKGELKRPNRCSLCRRKAEKVNGHHKDYSEPLTVQWVCSSCHAVLHGKTAHPENRNVIRKDGLASRRVLVTMDKEVWRRVDKKCRLRGHTLSSAIREALYQWFPIT